jgi:hypothetical protein
VIVSDYKSNKTELCVYRQDGGVKISDLKMNETLTVLSIGISPVFSRAFGLFFLFLGGIGVQISVYIAQTIG